MNNGAHAIRLFDLQGRRESSLEGTMENLVFLAPFIPFLAMLPPSLAAVWIANPWLKSRGTSADLLAEVAARRDEVAALRQGLFGTAALFRRAWR